MPLLQQHFVPNIFYAVKVRGSAGEHSEAKGGLYDVSNRERMGLTEFQVKFELSIFEINRI